MQKTRESYRFAQQNAMHNFFDASSARSEESDQHHALVMHNLKPESSGGGGEEQKNTKKKSGLSLKQKLTNWLFKKSTSSSSKKGEAESKREAPLERFNYDAPSQQHNYYKPLVAHSPPTNSSNEGKQQPFLPGKEMQKKQNSSVELGRSLQRNVFPALFNILHLDASRHTGIVQEYQRTKYNEKRAITSHGKKRMDRVTRR